MFVERERERTRDVARFFALTKTYTYIPMLEVESEFRANCTRFKVSDELRDCDRTYFPILVINIDHLHIPPDCGTFEKVSLPARLFRVTRECNCAPGVPDESTDHLLYAIYTQYISYVHLSSSAHRGNS